MTPTSTAIEMSANTHKAQGDEHDRDVRARRAPATRTTRPTWLMLNATTNRIAASVGERHVEGQRREHDQHQQRSVAACAMPATGCRRRAGCWWRCARWRRSRRTRRRAPRPCSRAPCPTSSWLGSCLVPIMPSATVAESSDSIAPSRATATAGCRSSSTGPRSAAGSSSGGSPTRNAAEDRPDGRDARRVEDRDSRRSRRRAPPSVRESCRRTGIRGQRATSSRLAMPSAVVAGCRCGSASSSCGQLLVERRRRSTLGSPKKFSHCPTQMTIAMPAVKPRMTDSGMKRITPPSLRQPEQQRASRRRAA